MYINPDRELHLYEHVSYSVSHIFFSVTVTGYTEYISILIHLWYFFPVHFRTAFFVKDACRANLILAKTLLNKAMQFCSKQQIYISEGDQR